MKKDKYRVAFVAPTAFFYQAPIFRELAANPRIDLMVYFCSDEAIRGADVLRKFETDEQWGDSERTLSGYEYKFLKNYSPFPSYLSWPLGLINLGIWRELKNSKPDAVVFMSWVNVTDLITISASRFFRLPLLLLTDASIQAEPHKSKIITWIKKIALKNIVFKLTSGFLYSGTANKLLYQSYGVPDRKLVPFAFSWETKDFLQEANTLKSQRTRMRTEMGISEESFVILFCGRLSSEKSPLDLLKAFDSVELTGKDLIFVGDGKLKSDLEKFVLEHDIKSVRFLGFQNRSEIGKFYAIADTLVLPSSQEATGAVVTEAMSFGLPIIVSDKVGFGMDLVNHGSNGFIFPVGDTSALAGYITQLMEASEEKREEMGKQSRELVEKWSNLNLADSLLDFLDSLNSTDGKNSG